VRASPNAAPTRLVMKPAIASARTSIRKRSTANACALPVRRRSAVRAWTNALVARRVVPTTFASALPVRRRSAMSVRKNAPLVGEIFKQIYWKSTFRVYNGPERVGECEIDVETN